jgi:hypothetical protein
MSPRLQARSDAATMVLLPTAPMGVIVEAPVVEAYGAEPWNRRNVAGFAVSTALGAGLLVASYLGVSAEVRLKDQVPFLDLGVGGLLAGAVGGVWWLAAVVKAVRLRKAAAVALVRSRFESVEAAGPAGPAEGFVAAARMTRYHQPTCSLVSGKDVSAATPAEHSAAGRRPCGVCGA